MGYSDIPREAYVNDFRRAAGRHFEVNPHLSVGDGDSAHVVMFGTSHQLGDIAVKPFSKETKAQREGDVMRLLRERGFDTLEPVTVATGSLATYLATRRRPDLNNLGQLDWSVDVGSRRLKTEIVPTLHAAAQLAGDLHGNGIVHGDLQAKNVAFNRDGDPVVVDVEKTQLGQSSHTLETGRQKDLALFGRSTIARGLLHDRSPTYRVGFLSEEFVMPSLERSAQAGHAALDPEVTKSAVEASMAEIAKRRAPGHQMRIKRAGAA